MFRSIALQRLWIIMIMGTAATIAACSGGGDGSSSGGGAVGAAIVVRIDIQGIAAPAFAEGAPT